MLASKNVFYHPTYSFRLPHETNLSESAVKYKRRFERFTDYKNSANNDEPFLFVRMIHYTGRYGVEAESLKENYDENCYERWMKYLPSNSKILLISCHVLSAEDKNQIFGGFYVVDDVMNPEHIAYGDYVKSKRKIIQCYDVCFEYMDKNFNDLNTEMMQSFISNAHIGL